MVCTSSPTSSTMPTYSWPMGAGPLTGSMPRYGHRSDPHTQVADSRMTASVGFSIFGSSRVSTRMSRGAWSTAPRMVIPFVGWCWCRPGCPGDRSVAVVGLGDGLEPGHDLTLLVGLVEGDVRHEAVRRRAVPVL